MLTRTVSPNPSSDIPTPSRWRLAHGRRGVAVAIAAVLAVIAVASGAAASTESSSTLGASTTSRLDRAIRQEMRQEGVPGAIVGVWTPKRNYVRAFGVADTSTRAPMRVDFSHRIGSITKTFTVTAVLQLVDQGKVGLDDPISKSVAGVPDGDQITIRELARMQSGLFDYLNDEDFQNSLVANPQQQWTTDQLLQIAFRHPPVFAPGTSFKYTNTNTVLLGVLVQTLTGQPIETYIDQHIVKPLNLDHTAFPTANDIPSPHANGYVDVPGESQLQDVTDWSASWGGAAGAMYSHLDDMRTWAKAFGTGALLSPATQAERLATVPYPGEPDGTTYGLGLEGFNGWVGHCGDLFGYNSVELYLPSERATLVIFANIYPSQDLTRTPVVVLANAVSKIVSPANVIPVFDAPEGLSPLTNAH
jgi:D-alanyl-D-alanine carboxypeptidase